MVRPLPRALQFPPNLPLNTAAVPRHRNGTAFPMTGRETAMSEVRRDSAVKLVDVLAGVSPAGANCPVGTVVISGDGAGDQTVGSPEVKALDGWMQIWSAPTGWQTKQQVVA
jgi:hypothetical protein